MPRATRAAARAQEQAEEAATAATVALPPTPTKERAPLGEISHNSNAVIKMVIGGDNEEKKPVSKGKKGKGGKKGKKGAKPKVNDAPIEILEDDDQSSHSDATDQACDLLLAAGNPETQDNIALPDTTISSPSDAAIEMAALTLSPPPTSPEADATVDANMGKTTEGNSAPLASQKNKTSEEQPPNEQSSKRISRIEDSVEALDALEDAIEKIGEAMPVSASDASSPEANRKSTRSPKAQLKTASVHGQKSSKATSRRTPAASTSTSKPPLGRTKTATEAKRTLSTNSPAAKQRSLEARKASETVSKQPMSTSKRISSVHKAPFQPVKSSKPVTKSNFELPGEAVARKLKEQREERQKREEEGLKTTSQAPSGTPQKRRAPEVKMTATARARLSLAQNGTVTSGKAPVTAISASKTGAKATKPTTKDSHPAKTRAPLPKPRAPVSANTSVKRGSLATSSIVSRQVSTSSQPRTSIGGDLSNQKVRGKEVFSRPKQVLKAKEDEKKAKEEAAKKARIEAAERGRLASREWAEKQKARNLAAQAAKAASENEATAA